MPPFTLIACPVSLAAAGLARKTISGAMSAGVTTPRWACAYAFANSLPVKGAAISRS